MVQQIFAGRLHLHGKDISRLQRLLDPLMVTLLFVLFLGPVAYDHPELRLQPWMWVLACSTALLSQGGIYRSYRNKSLVLLLRRVSSSWALVLGAVLLLTFVTKTTATFSRVDLGLWALLAWLVLLGNHIGLRKVLRWHRSRGGNSRTVLYWGLPAAAAAFAEQLQHHPWLGLKLVAWFSPQPPSDSDEHGDLESLYAGGYEAMRGWLSRQSVDRIVFSHVSTNGLSMADVLKLFGDTSLPVVYAPHWADPAMHFKVDYVGEQCCIDLWGSERALSDRQLKRAVDLLLSAAALLLLSPLLLLIALAVKFSSPGPVLFVQDRYGLDGRRIPVFKFRTMRVLEDGQQPGLRQACRHDPRVTAVGAVLRRWSLDELPQLINVLRGEMSLVGPRPHAVAHNEQYRSLIPGYMQRHAFKPGITGLAQVEGLRGETPTVESMASRVNADLRYQRDWSLRLDLKILIKTVLTLRSPNAY
jgi:putative colanic acid biosynthesis UDP-glucose lipid carrier transferase